MTQVTQIAQVGLGNTSTKPPKIRARAWCLTINNPQENEIDTIIQSGLTGEYIFGLEIGEEKTEHIQGYIKYKNPVSFIQMKKRFPRAHIEKAKGSVKQNWEYCSKEGKYKSNIDLRTPQERLIESILKQEYNLVRWKPWQEKILSQIRELPDKRKIHWYWESTGNIGKSYLCKYMAIKHNVIIADGKKSDIFHSIFKIINEEKKVPEAILLDIPRTNENFINYGVLEQIKNGCIYSGKYEGGMCIYPIPHLFVFANFEPDKSKMSSDRWDITELGGIKDSHTSTHGVEVSCVEV